MVFLGAFRTGPGLNIFLRDKEALQAWNAVVLLIMICCKEKLFTLFLPYNVQQTTFL